MAMTSDDLRTAVHSAINNIPHAVGVNNHMGSKVTADLKTMTWIMQELKTRDLAFIDSRTTIDTVAEEAAQAQGVPTNRRHVFLDNERSAAAIRVQLDEAVYRSRMEGEIVAIGHLDKVTIEVLARGSTWPRETRSRPGQTERSRAVDELGIWNSEFGIFHQRSVGESFTDRGITASAVEDS